MADPYFLDLSDERCPMALVKFKLALKARQPEEVLQVLLSDPVSRQDVPRWLKKIGQSFHYVHDGADHLVIQVDAE